MSAILPACHVLVLGAGLAGLTAAIAAKKAAPQASVILVCPAAGPTGSSFRNRNDRLGVHAPQTAAEAEAFAAEALRLGHPGRIDPGLVAILASEAAPRLGELLDAGITVIRESDGTPQRFPSCFSPTSRRAVILGPLDDLFTRLSAQAVQAGVILRPGYSAWTLVRRGSSRVAGVVLAAPDGDTVFQPAGSVIAAMGGPVPLFARHLAGPGNPGYGHGLLAAAGASLANTGFLQWMWASWPDGAFWPVQTLAQPQARLLDPCSGTFCGLPPQLAALAEARAGHAPVGDSLPDAALDAFVLATADAQGLVTAQAPDGTTIRAALVPQAANGGAVIDADGHTDLAGLFAAGECATAMHGANRIGGAMAAACLVFGSRAGRTAMVEATGRNPGEATTIEAGKAVLATSRAAPGERRPRLERLGRLLTAKATPGAGRDADGLLRELGTLLAATTDIPARRAIQAATALSQGLEAKTPGQTAGQPG